MLKNVEWSNIGYFLCQGVGALFFIYCHYRIIFILRFCAPRVPTYTTPLPMLQPWKLSQSPYLYYTTANVAAMETFPESLSILHHCQCCSHGNVPRVPAYTTPLPMLQPWKLSQSPCLYYTTANVAAMETFPESLPILHHCQCCSHGNVPRVPAYTTPLPMLQPWKRSQSPFLYYTTANVAAMETFPESLPILHHCQCCSHGNVPRVPFYTTPLPMLQPWKRSQSPFLYYTTANVAAMETFPESLSILHHCQCCSHGNVPRVPFYTTPLPMLQPWKLSQSPFLYYTTANVAAMGQWYK